MGSDNWNCHKISFDLSLLPLPFTRISGEALSDRKILCSWNSRPFSWEFIIITPSFHLIPIQFLVGMLHISPRHAVGNGRHTLDVFFLLEYFQIPPLPHRLPFIVHSNVCLRRKINFLAMKFIYCIFVWNEIFLKANGMICWHHDWNLRFLPCCNTLAIY